MTAKSARVERGMIWTTTAPNSSALAKLGYAVYDYGRLVKEYIEPIQALGIQRQTLESAAAPLLALFAQHPAVAVLNVAANTPGDLQRIYGLLVEPAYRRDCALLIHANVELDQLRPEQFVDPVFGYPWTLQRLNYLAERYRRRSIDASLPPMTPIEEELFDAMQAVGLSPRTQYGIGPYRADFAFPERMLAVEADGRAWHDAERDRRRDQRLSECGWRVVRFTGSRITREADACAQEVFALYQTLPETVVYSDLEEADPRLSIWRRFLNWLRGLFGASSSDLEAEAEESAESQPHPHAWLERLDSAQRAAVTAHEGVVQVLAPAGSGKTRVLVARVQELISQGVPAERILCTTFNAASQVDLEKRLRQAGVDGVAVRTFHSLGRHILDQEKKLRGEIGNLTFNHWRRLAGAAKNEAEGRIWIDAPEASEAISNYKLVDMIGPEEAAARASTPFARTAARIYALYEEELARLNRNDFDDLVLNAVRLLQTNEPVRRKWQEKWECVLVDEYQDIELTQELLVQLLAAPEDCLMVVGDEDQCIYTWRRAEVERIINLDKRYPGLERAVLTTCYRCPPDVVAASSQLIQHNRNRFPKNTVAEPHKAAADAIELQGASDPMTAAKKIADSLRSCDPAETVVLARTSRLLRTVAAACAAAHVPFRAGENVLHSGKSEQVLLAYLRLLANPNKATAEDVNNVFRVPNRYLPDGAEQGVAQQLRSGRSFRDAVRPIRGEEWRVRALTEGAELLDRLAAEKDAQAVIQLLRTEGGLDKYYSDQERMSAHDQVEIEMLDEVQAESGGKSVRDVVQSLEQREKLLAGAAAENGLELATIHGAKGREWNTVIVFGCDDDQLPHQRVITNPQKQTKTQSSTGPAELEKLIEDERRLAYVAMTRAKAALELVYTEGKPSRFLVEAGFLEGQPSAATAGAPSTNKSAAASNTSSPWWSTAGVNSYAAEVPAPAARPGWGAPHSAPNSTTNFQYRAKTRPMPSKYANTCPACGDRIVVGQPICRAESNGREAWVHEHCAVKS
ncbi:MAG: UvrD-helicase domain-containing protein [Caldilineaceae bacterium]